MGERQLFRIPNIFGGMDTNHTEEIKASAGKFRAVQNMRFDGVVGKKRGGQSGYGVNLPNLIYNGSFETWSGGASVAPDNWTLQGSGATIAREATIIKLGTYSAKLTRVGNDCQIYQDFAATKGLAYWKGKTITVSCWVYATVANRVQLHVEDGVGSTYSAYHTGDSTWQLITVTHTVSLTATYLSMNCDVFNGNTSAYFDGVMCVEGATAATYSPATYIDTNPVLSAFRFYPDDYTRSQIVTSGTNIYKGTDATGVFTSIKSGLTSGKRFSFTTMYDISGNLQCIMFNGYDTPQQWDGNAGSTSAITGSPPLDKFVVWHKDRLFTAGSAATPHNLNFCANSNPNDWTTADDAGTIDVGFKITGLATLADYLVIFGEKQIKLLIGYSYDTYQLTEPFTDFGTVCPYSIAMGNGVIYFLTQVANGQYHVATFDGASARLLNMDEVVISMPYPARVEQISGVYYNNHYLLAYPSTDGANDRQLVYNAKLGFYESIDVGINASCYCKWDGVGDSGELYAGDSNEGFLWKQDISTLLDGATAISAFCETAYYDLGGSEYYKEITDVYLRCGLSTTQTLTVLAEVTDGTTTNSEVLTGTNASVTTEYRHSHFGMTANNVAVKLSNATASKDMAIYQISFKYEVKALR